MAEKKVAFVGLGVMGGPMAGHLFKENPGLLVYNRTSSKADPLVASGATASNLNTIGESCDVIVICVSRSEDVRECIDRMPILKQNCLIIDHSTIAPEKAVEIAKLVADRGGRFVDAPVSGGSMGAQKGLLTIFMGGEEADCAEAIEVCKPYTKRAERVGKSGSGQMAKMVNQIAVAGALLSLCESLAFAEKAGLDVEQVRSLVAGGAGGSWNFENYGPKIVKRDWTPGFTVDNQIKDLDYCREASDAIGAKIPATDLANELLKKMRSEGHGSLTTVALFEQYLEPNG